MSVLTRIVCCVVSAVFLISLPTYCAYSQANPNDSGIPDTILFNEISLSEEGVVAYDTAGGQWEYDFEKTTFSRSDISTIEDRVRDRGMESILPVADRCTEERRLSDIQKSALIGYDEYVEGDVIAYGKVTVKGWVRGDVHSFNRQVTVTESGQVDGDVRAPEIVIKEGGIVKGEEILTDPIEFPVDVFTDRFSTDGIWIVFGFTLFLVVVIFLSTVLMPRQVLHMQDCISRHRARSFFLGLLIVILMPVLAAVLAVTIVGAVVVPFLPLAYLFALSLAMTATGIELDGRFSRRSADRENRLMYQAFIGLAPYIILWVVVAVLLGSTDHVSQGFGIFFLVVSILASSYALCTGTGAAVLTRFGFRTYISFRERRAGFQAEAPAPAPPPMPETPPVAAPLPRRPEPPEKGTPLTPPSHSSNEE